MDYVKLIKDSLAFIENSEKPAKLKDRRHRDNLINGLKTLLFEMQGYQKCPNGHESVRNITGAEDQEKLFMCLECDERWSHGGTQRGMDQVEW